MHNKKNKIKDDNNHNVGHKPKMKKKFQLSRELLLIFFD